MERGTIINKKVNKGYTFALLISRLIVGGILIFASIDKISDPSKFATAISNYHLIPFGLENTLAIVLPWVELLAGICLVLGIFLDGAAFLAIVLMSIFIIGISFAIANGYNIECGCGLKPGEMVGFKKIIEDLIYLGLSLFIFYRKDHNYELFPK